MSVDYGIINGNTLIYIRHKDITTVADFKAWLAQQKANGTPVIVEYNLRNEELELYSEEQKTALEQLNKFKTYKNVTNIFTDSNAILNVSYKKDLETVINNKQDLQDQIDEIKLLISTSKTSALLLDNLQSDLEKEVI